MKLTKATWIALIVGVILIAGVTLGWTYSQQIAQQNQLDKNLTEAKQKLAQLNLDDLNTQKAQLTQQIGDSNAKAAAVKTSLIFSKNSIDSTNILLGDAQSHNVEVLEITSSGRSSENLAGNNFETIAIVLKVKGSLQNIADLAVSLNERFPVSIENVIQIDRLPPPPSATPTPTPIYISTPTPSPNPTPPPPGFTPIPTTFASGTKDFSANINLVVYNYKGE